MRIRIFYIFSIAPSYSDLPTTYPQLVYSLLSTNLKSATIQQQVYRKFAKRCFAKTAFTRYSPLERCTKRLICFTDDPGDAREKQKMIHIFNFGQCVYKVAYTAASSRVELRCSPVTW